MTVHGSHADTHDDTAPDHAGPNAYLAVFGALCVLTLFSFLTYFEFWRDAIPIEVGRAFMMAVSCTKAMLVILFFMHVKYEASWKYVLTIPPAIMAIFLMLALVPDIGLRGYWYSEERELYMAEPAVHQVGGEHTEEGDFHGKHEADQGGAH